MRDEPEIMDTGYMRMLETLLVCRNASYRSDPEREQAMREITTDILVQLLQRLARVTT